MKRKQKIKITYRMALCSLSVALLLPVGLTGLQEKEISANANALSLGISSVGNLIKLSSYDEKIQAANEEKERLEDKKKETEQKISELEKEKEDILTYIEKLDKELNTITLEIERLQGEIKTNKEELEQTKKELMDAKQTEEDQYETMKKRIQFMYENGGTSLLETLLSSNNLVDFLNQVEYSKKISEYDNNLFQSYKETKELIATKEAYLTAQLEELNTLEEHAEFEQSTMQQLMADKNKEVEKYEASIEKSNLMLLSYNEQIEDVNYTIEEVKEQQRIEEEKIKKLKEEEERRRQEEERRKQEAANNQQNGNNSSSATIKDETSSDKMIWPLPGDGRIFTYFGNRKAPIAGASTYHRGLDIGGEMGASIVASLSGTVEIAQYSSSSGNFIIINHGNGLRTAYCHCSKLLVSVGQYVKQGEVIALVGSTGISTGPHLHFGVSIDNVYVDPLNYISY